MRMLFLIVLLGILISTVIAAQTLMGTSSGVVQDALRNGLHDVEVTLTNVETGKSYKAITNGSGEYRLDLPEGKYELKAELPGFQRLKKSGVEIKESRTTKLNLRLIVGTFS